MVEADGVLPLSPHALKCLLQVMSRPNTSKSKPRRHRASYFPLPAVLDLEDSSWTEVVIQAVGETTLTVSMTNQRGLVNIRLSTVKGIAFGEQAEQIMRREYAGIEQAKQAAKAITMPPPDAPKDWKAILGTELVEASPLFGPPPSTATPSFQRALEAADGVLPDDYPPPPSAA